MRFIVLAFIAGAAFSQTADDAARLIQEVAGNASHTTAWQIDGTVTYDESDATSPAEQFRLLTRSPVETRFEQGGVTAPAVIVCDGSNAWVFSPPLGRCRKESATGNAMCSPILGEWKLLSTRLQEPMLAGSCGPDPSTESQRYKLVRGFIDSEITSDGRMTRTVCIDPDRKLIMWERWESRYSTRLYKYSIRNPQEEFTSDTFKFQPPAGSTLTEFELPVPRSPGTLGMSHGAGISLPRLVRKKEPKYGARSRKARIQGTVLLYVVIGIDGAPSDVLVYRSLSSDLDVEAVRCIREWRFTPGTNHGEPAAIPVTIEVNFRLLER